MSTATELATNGHRSPATMDPDALEKLILGGDLSRLSGAQKIQWYNLRCERAGLDPATQPLEYLKLQGKEVLYAKKAATDQLTDKRKLSLEIVSEGPLADLGVYRVQCRVRKPDGTTCDDVGIVPIAGLRGDALCNAILKCVTKAKRRAVLSACGLGMLDESELETIAAAPAPEPAGPKINVTPGQIDKFSRVCREFVDRENNEWTMECTAKKWPSSLLMKDPWQLTLHLAKWASQTGRLPILPRTGDRTAWQNAARHAVAAVYAHDQEAVEAEMEDYAGNLWNAAQAKFEAQQAPEVESQEREPGEDA